MELLNPPNIISGGTGGGYYSETLIYSDTVNEILGPLNSATTDVELTNLFIISGIPQDYITDFTIRQVAGGLTPGWYICLSPTSTAPSGGTFFGSQNPATGISTNMEVGDKARVVYPIS